MNFSERNLYLEQKVPSKEGKRRDAESVGCRNCVVWLNAPFATLIVSTWALLQPAGAAIDWIDISGKSTSL